MRVRSAALETPMPTTISRSPSRLSRVASTVAAAALALSALHCNGTFFLSDPSGPGGLGPIEGVKPLTKDEQAFIRTQGFAISTDTTVGSFHWGYTGLFKNHEPLYFTADAMLHAVHRSYDHILRDLEEQALSDRLGSLIDSLRRGLAASKEGDPEVRADLDLYLAVTKALHSGAGAAPVAGADRKRVDEIAAACQAASGMATLQLFGADMQVDYSMLKPRGHYTSSEKLQRYFRSFMWLARTEIRVATTAADKIEVNRRALLGTLLLRSLFDKDAEATWNAIDAVTAAFVGPSDSMSFPGLQRAWEGAGKPTLAEAKTLPDGRVVEIFAKESEQKIGSQLLHPGEKSVAFLMFGQRYVADSEVLSRVSYGQLPQKRMMPSPLDVGWAVFENPAAKKLLQPELDAFAYEAPLEAARKNARSLGPAVWDSNLYHLWLGALQKLSPDAERDKGLPAVMRGEGWSRRLLNTQLASWAELRHDNLLYAKESFTAVASCAFPDAYVDPYPELFAAIERFAAKGRAAVALLPELKKTRGVEVEAYFKRLGEIAGTLGAIATRERNGEPLLPEHLDFFNYAVSVDGKHAGCTTVYEPGGWYADLYYWKIEALWHQQVVADVHTQPTDEEGNPVGHVLHVGTDYPHPFAVTLESCNGPVTYRGFVSSYRQVVTNHFQRLTDEAWQQQKSTDHPLPAWLKSLGP
jgi:hypothetical protein